MTKVKTYIQKPITVEAIKLEKNIDSVKTILEFIGVGDECIHYSTCTIEKYDIKMNLLWDDDIYLQ